MVTSQRAVRFRQGGRGEVPVGPEHHEHHCGRQEKSRSIDRDCGAEPNNAVTETVMKAYTAIYGRLSVDSLTTARPTYSNYFQSSPKIRNYAYTAAD